MDKKLEEPIKLETIKIPHSNRQILRQLVIDINTDRNYSRNIKIIIDGEKECKAI